jgi:hypothetical protein
VGPFGEGKTSALNLLGASLNSRPDLIVITFSSWLPGDEQTLAFSLFGTIAEQIKSRYVIPGLSNELDRFARLLAGTVPKIGETLRKFFEEPSQVEQLRRLTGLLRELPIRVVVLVDELDRMDREELHLLLKAIRGVVDLPNITYVCAFNRIAVIRLISENDPLYGQSYLEKFFPMQLPLPRADQELLSTLFDSKFEGICETFKLLQNETEKKAFNEELLPLWHTSIKRWLTNFRRIRLFFNAFQASLAPVYAEVDLFDMMVLQLVKMISEETYEFIYENGPLFYYSSWRITLWMERLSVDDKEATAIRNKRLNAFFDSLPTRVKGTVTELLQTIFPTVDQCVRGHQFALIMQSPEDAKVKRRIFHPDYFPRYFIHQVPSGMFGRQEMTKFISELNTQNDIAACVETFRRTASKLESNPWKRWSFLDALVIDSGRLGAVQSEALVVGAAEISGSLERDFFGISEWGRTRALLFAAAKRFSETPKLQEVLVTAIRQATSDGFAADIVRYSTSLREQNNVIIDWRNVNEAAIKEAFTERMKTRYVVGSPQDLRYGRDDLSPFFMWVQTSDEDRMLEIAFFRDRFERHPTDQGRFLGWALRKDVVYQGDPLLSVEKLFPVEELFESVRQSAEDIWLEQDKESVQWFLELMQQRRAGIEAAVPPITVDPLG